ncbi:TetR family transcriptional regulator [Zavarzinia sp. CC-PAN008]|uniref:TetR family transcriptional regulator n=1 Tax=Zavarzinia sp. CC-PAN008 TaxID=3243332 RepID=UPI003F743776
MSARHALKPAGQDAPTGAAGKRDLPPYPAKALAAKVAKAERTRARIIRVTKDLVYRLGSDRVTLRNIAAASRMKPSSLYYHFRSKDEIIEAVLDDGIDRGREAVERAIAAAGEEALPRLEAAFRAHLAHVVAERLSSRMGAIRRLPARIRDRHMARERDYGQIFARLLAEAQAEGQIRADLDLSLLRMLGMGALTWAGEWFDDSRARTLDDIADEFLKILRTGVVPPS